MKTMGTKLTRIMQLSKESPEMEFKWLMPHFNLEAFVKCFEQLDRKKAIGVDRISKDEYGKNLEKKLKDLITRMKRLSYRPQAVREVLIPKEGQEGRFRALGVSTIEDKIVQTMTTKVLEAIYEPIFLESSYGFRRGKSCHTAIKAARDYLFRNHCQIVIDVDLKNFFGTIDHKRLKNLLEIKIKDKLFIRYVVRMLKSGIMNNGNFRITEEGIPQGNVASPILANIYAHYTIDSWFETTVKKYVQGKVEMFRYADDIIICCKYEHDAIRIMKALKGRLSKFSLELNMDKTKLVKFDKYKEGRGEEQETFDFLGFTFYNGKSRNGVYIPKVRTSGKRFKNKLKRVNLWCKENRCRFKLKELWVKFVSKLRGHIQYYGVTYNIGRVYAFVFRAVKIFYKWINRRSQKRSLNLDKFYRFMRQFPLPGIKVIHPLY